MISRKQWFNHGFFNTLEHALTRAFDALTTLTWISYLSLGHFSKIALAQAVIAPFLLLFVSPSTILYKEYQSWKSQGASHVASRLSALRFQGMFLMVLALVLSLLLFGYSHFSKGETSFDYLYALIISFSLTTGIHFSGADREFLRLDLDLKKLSRITFVQKAILLTGSLFVCLRSPERLDLLALISVFSWWFSSYLVTRTVFQKLTKEGATLDAWLGRHGPSRKETILESLKSFSLWGHFNGVVLNWVLTMDLFFLGIFYSESRDVGLYAAVLKIANLSNALPIAAAHLFQIWLSRTNGMTRKQELASLKQNSTGLFLLTTFQNAFLLILTPWLLQLLSRGRWSAFEMARMEFWLGWMLAGLTLWHSVNLMNNWLTLRSPIHKIFYFLWLPWGTSSLAIYYVAVKTGGVTYAAKANAAVSVVFMALVLLRAFFVIREEDQKTVITLKKIST